MRELRNCRDLYRKTFSTDIFSYIKTSIIPLFYHCMSCAFTHGKMHENIVAKGHSLYDNKYRQNMG